jgi:hypothetical protein
MTCNSNCYLPFPPRAWSRVQNSCSLIDNIQGDNLVQVPYSGKLVYNSALYLENAMLNKGNVLQYKKNSSNLTKQQRYAQIAKGQWTNRNTTWATQSTRGYTNPNNQSLLRVGSVNVTLAGVPTTDPVTCPKPVTPIYDILPPGGSGGSGNPEVLPPPPPPPTGGGGTALPDTVPEPPVEPIVIQDFGNLVCGTQENICTGEIIRQPTDTICYPTTFSDVPGPIIDLCWDDGTPTWYPRQRYIMTNSANKWPVNATLLSAVKPLPPVITSISSVETDVTLTWTFDPKCLPVNDFIIYEDGIPIKIVSGNTFTTSITVNNCATYTFYIVGSNGTVLSNPSNSVSIEIYLFTPIPPTITSVTSTCSSGITIYWEYINTQCFPINFYTIYQDGVSIANTTSSPYTVTSLIDCKSYSYYIITTFKDGSVSPQSNTVPGVIFPCAVQNLSIINLKDTCLTLTWTIPSSICIISSYDIYKDGTQIANVSSGTTSYLVSNLTSNQLYSFYVVSIGNPNTTQSAVVSATTVSNAPTNLTITASCVNGGVNLSWVAPTNTCDSIASYNIYNTYNSIVTIFNTLNTTYFIQGYLLAGGTNNFYIVALFTSTMVPSLPSTPTVNIVLNPCPVLDLAVINLKDTCLTLTWTDPSSSCFISSYNIYQNGILINTVSSGSSPYSYLVSNLTSNQLYSFYIVSASGTTLSTASVSVPATTVSNSPTNLIVISSCVTGTVDLSWNAPANTCDTIASYNIYNNTSFLINTPDATPSYSINGNTLTCGSNDFYVVAVFTSTIVPSLPSTPPTNVNLDPCPPYITQGTVTFDSIEIMWTIPLTKCNIVSYNIYQDGSLVSTQSTLTYTAIGLLPNTQYLFYVVSVGANSQVSSQSNTLSITTLDYSTPIITDPTISPSTCCYKEATIYWSNTDTPLYYLFSLSSTTGTGTLINVIVNNNFYLCLGLTNGALYTINVTAVYPGSVNKIATPVSYTQPTTSTYFTIIGTCSISSTSSDTTLEFNEVTPKNTSSSASLTLNCNTSSAINSTATLVAGGGAGGSGLGTDISFSILTGGGGGGGGTVILNQPFAITYGPTISITIGGGGGAAASAGTSGSNGKNTIVDSFTATGGQGGGGGAAPASGAGGTGGSGGGAGGAGGIGNGALGSAGAAINDTGGGGGGSSGSGNNIGGSCSTYGGGGGGGSGFNVGFIGGDGGQGIVIFTIPN